jgi:hypothetical protein
MGILHDVVSLASDPAIPLESVLLKGMVLADALGDDDLLEWVTQELDGYRRESELPEYRVVRSQSYARITNGVYYVTVPAPPEALPASPRERATTAILEKSGCPERCGSCPRDHRRSLSIRAKIPVRTSNLIHHPQHLAHSGRLKVLV